jgi:hypothetical protein
MHHARILLVLVVALAAMVSVDLAHTLKTGRAKGRVSTITRARQPAGYWRYVYATCFALVLLALTVLWVILWPDSLR